jgi:hypothetical protein
VEPLILRCLPSDESQAESYQVATTGRGTSHSHFLEEYECGEGKAVVRGLFTDDRSQSGLQRSDGRRGQHVALSPNPRELLVPQELISTGGEGNGCCDAHDPIFRGPVEFASVGTTDRSARKGECDGLLEGAAFGCGARLWETTDDTSGCTRDALVSPSWHARVNASKEAQR